LTTDRKPPGVSWESWVERRIRVGIERGEFDGLPGAGQPLDALDEPRDDDWWVKDKLRREEIEFLPPTLRIRKDLEDARDIVRRVRDEQTVRMVLGEIDRQIRDMNRFGAAGPPSTLSPLDIDAEVERWRRERGIMDSE
jgi:Domain of unknown function (DUF1992)